MTDRLPPDRSPFATEDGAASAHLPEGPPDARWRRLDRLIVAAVMLALLVPAGLLVAGLRPPRLENRPLLQVPAFSIDGALDASWPAGLDAYLADNMALRGIAVRLRGELRWRTGGSGNPNVIPGRDGWAFLRGEFAPQCDETAEGIAAAVMAAIDRARTSGQELAVLVVPDKHVTYPEQLRPDLRFPPSCNELGRPVLQAMLADEAPVTVDGIALLAQARRDRPDGPRLFYSMDTHWTPSGAILAIRALVQSLDPAVWSDDDVSIDGTYRRTMDIAGQLGIRRTELTPKIVVRPGVTTERRDLDIPVDVGNARAVFRITSAGERPLLTGRTVIVYDSFFGISIPLVAPWFEDTTWIHVGDLVNHPELGELLGPFDRVILQRVERGLYQTDVDKVLRALIPAEPTSRGEPGVDMARWATRQADPAGG